LAAAVVAVLGTKTALVAVALAERGKLHRSLLQWEVFPLLLVRLAAAAAVVAIPVHLAILALAAAAVKLVQLMAVLAAAGNLTSHHLLVQGTLQPPHPLKVSMAGLRLETHIPQAAAAVELAALAAQFLRVQQTSAALAA